MADFQLIPLEGSERGQRILKDGIPFLDCTPGGTGPCWNISQAPDQLDPDDADQGNPIHVCELDEIIGALQALRDSDAHRENVERWGLSFGGSWSGSGDPSDFTVRRPNG